MPRIESSEPRYCFTFTGLLTVTSPWGTNDPTKGDRIVETDPWDVKASEFGWQNDGSTTFNVTIGNNGFAQANYEGDDAYLNDYRPVASDENFDFDFVISLLSFFFLLSLVFLGLAKSVSSSRLLIFTENLILIR